MQYKNIKYIPKSIITSVLLDVMCLCVTLLFGDIGDNGDKSDIFELVLLCVIAVFTVPIFDGLYFGLILVGNNDTDCGLFNLLLDLARLLC